MRYFKFGDDEMGFIDIFYNGVMIACVNSEGKKLTVDEGMRLDEYILIHKDCATEITKEEAFVELL